MLQLILGSGSPRRAQLLKELGYHFEVRSSDIEEVFNLKMSAEEIAKDLAKQKNKAIRIEAQEILLTADTVVALEKTLLAKPANQREASEMLEFLSGKTHQVITGVCIRSLDQTIVDFDTTDVRFKELSAHEIKHYIETFKPFDKAGGYGIQEWIGQIGIEWIHGSFYNVVGLPTQLVFKILEENFKFSYRNKT